VLARKSPWLAAIYFILIAINQTVHAAPAELPRLPELELDDIKWREQKRPPEKSKTESERDTTQDFGAANTVTLKHSVTFGLVIVLAGEYRVSLQNRKITLTDTRTMAQVVVLPTRSRRLPPKAVRARQAKVSIHYNKKNTNALLTVEYRGDRFRSRGVVGGVSLGQGTFDTGGKVADTKIEVSTKLSAPSLLLQSIDRYIPGVRHCAKHALAIDSPKNRDSFWRCACGIASGWKLARVEQSASASYFIVPFRAGMTITVDVTGNLQQCRTWLGRNAPTP